MKHLTRLLVLVALCVIGATQARAAFTLTAAPRWKPSDPTTQNVVLTWDPISGIGDSDYVVYCNGELAQNQGSSQITKNSKGKIECKQPLAAYDRNMTAAQVAPYVFKVVAVIDGKEQTASKYVSAETPVYHVAYEPFTFHANKYKIKKAAGVYTENIRIHWDAPAKGVTTEYVIKRKKITGSANSGWVDIAVLPEGKQEYIDKDLDLANSTYQYRVNARMANTLCLDPSTNNDEYNFVRGAAANPVSGSNPPYEQISNVMSTNYDTPQLTSPKVTPGRNAVTLSWILSQTSANIPTYFKVYRNNTLVATIDGLSTVDFNIPDNNPGEKYTYKVVAVYENAKGYIDRELESAPKTLNASVKLDVAKSRYAIDVVYNYPIIDSHDDNYKTHKASLGDAYVEGTGTFKNLKYALGMQGAPGDIYRQAVYRDGLWYISQLTDDDVLDTNNELTKKKSVAAGHQTGRGTSGGIVRVNANDPRKTINNNAYYDADGVTRLHTGRTFKIADRTNQSVAIDEITNNSEGHERILYRSSANITDYQTLFTCKMSDLGFRARSKGDDGKWGDWSAAKALTLSPVIDYSDSQEKQNGRVHYITANGRVNASAGGDVFMAPNRTASVFVYRMTLGKLSGTGIQYTCPTYKSSLNGDCLPQGFDLQLKDNIENYAFPVPGRASGNTKVDGKSTYFRSDFIHFIRNAGTYYVDGTEEKYHKIFDAKDTHTAGGCIFDFGDDKFYLKPTSSTRNNTGHFRVDICSKQSNGKHFDDYQSFINMEPAVAVVQDELTDFIAGNSNANWYGTEPGDGCVYIYQYVPGVRFAKYRFYKLNDFPRVDPTLEIQIAHDDEYDPQKVEKFNAVMSWQRPTNFDFSGSTDYSLDHYKVELMNQAGKSVMTWDQADNLYNGNDLEPILYEFVFDGKKLVDKSTNKAIYTNNNAKYHIDNQDYTLRVTPVFKSTKGDIIYGETRTDEASNDYLTKLTHQRARAFQSGKIYRVDLDFDLDESETIDNGETWKYGNEPADYYTIEMSTDGGSTWSHVPGLNIMYRSGKIVNINGKDVETTVLSHDEKANGKQTVTNHVVPGCYKFKRLPTPTTTYAHALSVSNTTDELAHSDKAYTNYEGDLKAEVDMVNAVFPAVAYHVFTSETEPDFTQYKYRFTVHHAVDNSYIYRSDAVEAWVENPGNGIVQTGVNDIVVDDDENAPVEYFNLQGMRLRGEPVPGQVVLRRQGNKVTKIIVK